MNSVSLVGRSVRDIELKTNGENNFCFLTLAVQRNFKNANGEYESDFVPCVANGKTADFINKYVSKGQKISITGEIRAKYDKEKQENKFNIKITNVDAFLCGKNEDANQVNQVPTNNAPTNNDKSPYDFVEASEEKMTADDLPF